MIDRETLLGALEQYKLQEEQALADANAARGARLAIEQLLALLDHRQQQAAAAENKE
jgi:hypothetical protein